MGLRLLSGDKDEVLPILKNFGFFETLNSPLQCFPVSTALSSPRHLFGVDCLASSQSQNFHFVLWLWVGEHDDLKLAVCP
jgi:hypothetical protein